MGLGEGYFSNYPKHVFLILTNEFCERFSFYGMKAILVLYLTNALGFSDNTATSIYHAFNAVCYFTPLFGAMVADGWLGKFRTILYVSVIYGIGNIVMAGTAIPINGEYIVWPPFIGLTLIAIGTGGIKPCVSAFGGDQFDDTQKRQKDSFFSLFYMAINVGSLLSMIITPIIRSQVYCFDDPCYCLAFGIPAALMVSSIFVFAAGSKWYTKVPPGESTIAKLFGCVWIAMKGKFSCSKKSSSEKKEHWLDYAEVKYEKSFIADVKDVLKVCWMFLPLPVFWALFDQQGSRWTLQATQMDGDFDGFIMQPDMMQVLNPLLVVIFVPILESLIYPCLDKLKIPNRPLQRMGLGMILAAVAFTLSGFLQLAIDNDVPQAMEGIQAKIKFYNTNPCEVRVDNLQDPSWNVTVKPFEASPYYYIDEGTKDYEFTADLTTCTSTGLAPVNISVILQSGKAYQLFYESSGTEIELFQQEKVDPTPKGESFLRIYNSLDRVVDIELKTTGNKEENPRKLYDIQPHNVSRYEPLIFADFYMKILNTSDREEYQFPTLVRSKNGPVYTLLLGSDPANPNGDPIFTIIEEVPTYSINIFLQVPQYIIMTLSECFFSVTGLSFAYSQAPVSMKAFLQAMWLMVVAFGNIIVIIISESGSSMSQMTEFFLFAGLMFATTILFAIMAVFYEYVTPREAILNDVKSDRSSTSGSIKGNDNKAFNNRVDIENEKVSTIKSKKTDEVMRRKSSSVKAKHDSDSEHGTAL